MNTTAKQPILSIKGLQVAYGGIQAVKGVDMDVYEGELVTLIGANGAGKTTTLKAITGILPYKSGDVIYQGKSIKGAKAWDLVAQGLVMVPEGRGVFARMTIVENLQMGAYLFNDKTLYDKGVDYAFETFPRLKERANQLAGTLSGGEQQMLAMARALMSQPKLLILDEPSMGLSPVLTEVIFKVIDKVSKEGITVVLVEQNANLALQAADRGYVMDSGNMIMTGNAHDLLTDPKVQAAYLGA
ncbi:MAG: ABC transporter ATP-binding protein [Hydromonas sp.]|mgnify:FL=1|jgi:branched-chain amino acid transport system ATP-binding protein|nr:ABC transporter ATP-binding protein [Hydromonas sp.]MBP6294555.1 ABC transporter ATP-binding protein [Hydromonas sp.]